MKKIIKYHNIYWVEDNPIGIALSDFLDRKRADDNILFPMIELDILWHCTDIYIGHSWRPLTNMYYGKLRDFMQEINEFSKNYGQLYLYIEFKDGKHKTIDRLDELFYQYKTDDIKICFSASDSNLIKRLQGRKSLMNKALNKLGNKYNLKTLEQIKSEYELVVVDLFKKDWRHF